MNLIEQLKTINQNSHLHKINPQDAIDIELRFIENIMVEFAKTGENCITLSVIHEDAIKEHFEKLGLKVIKYGCIGDSFPKMKLKW